MAKITALINIGLAFRSAQSLVTCREDLGPWSGGCCRRERRAALAPDEAARLCGAGMEARIEAVAGASTRSPDCAYAGGPRTIRVFAIAVSVSCGPRRG